MRWVARFTLILILLFFSVEITAGKFCSYKKIDENGGNFVIEISLSCLNSSEYTRSHRVIYQVRRLFFVPVTNKLCNLSAQHAKFCFPLVAVQLLSRVCLFCDPTGYSPPGSSVHGSLQAGTLEWVAGPSSRGASRPRMEPVSPALAGGFFAPEPPGKPLAPHTESHAAGVMPQGYSFHTPIQPTLRAAPPSPRGLAIVGPAGEGAREGDLPALKHTA